MKKLLLLLMLLITTISASAKTTAYAPISRVGAGELEYGVNYMIFNTANTPESYPHRWGAVYYDGSIKTYGGAVPESFSTNDTKYLFQLSDANTLYSVGQSANVGTSYSFTPWQDGAAADKGNVYSRNDDGTNIASSSIDASTKVWLINNGSQYWNGNNWSNVGDNCFAFWSTAHPYAIYTVSEVTVVDVTYILQETNGTEVSRTTVTQRANSAANAPSSMVSNSYSLSLSGTIGDDDCNIIVTRTPIETSIDFTDYEVRYDVTTTETSSITDGQWYLLTQVRGGESPAYDAGAGNTIKRAAANSVSITKGTDPATVSQYLVRFFSTGVGDGKYIQFATGNFWKDVQSDASSATTYLVYPARNNSSEGYDGWAINNSVDGKTYERKVDNNSAGNNISFWDAGKTTTGTNNIWKLYPVELIYQPVTFDVVISDGNTSNTYNNITHPNGEVITASDVLNISSDYISSTSHTVTTADAGQTINLTVTPNANLSNLLVSNSSVATTTSAIEEGKWYILTQTRRADTNNQTCETAAYDNGEGHTIKRAAEGVTANSLLAQNTPASDISQYLVRFINTGVGNGYYIQFGNGHYWGSNLKTTTNFFSAGSYLVYNATQNADNSTGWAINLTTDGTTYGSKVDNNGNGNGLSFWGEGQTTSGTNNIWKLYPVELDEPISFDVVLTDGTNSRTFSGVNSVIGATLTASDFLSISNQYINVTSSTSHEIVAADENQTVTLTVSATPTAAMPIENGATYAWQSAVGNNPSYVNVDGNGDAVNPNNHSIDLTQPVSADHVWQISGNVINGYSLKNVSANQYLGGRTATGGTMTMESTPSLFFPVYNDASSFKWKNEDYNYWIDRSGGKPYTFTAGNNNSLTQLWPVTISLSDPAATLTIGGESVANNTTCYISASAAIAVGGGYTIDNYNGEATVADALAALGAAGGTLTINVTQDMSNITINVVNGARTVKTVTLENVAAGHVITVADEVGTPNFVTGFEPATITATSVDQTVSVTYTSTLPFTTTADPTSDDAPAYVMTLHEKHAQGNNLGGQYNITPDYLWTFGGDEFNGITVYNKVSGYLNVTDANNSIATFSSTPTVYAINPNSHGTNGFNLNLPNTNTYINDYSNAGKISTWQDVAGNNNNGSCIVVTPEATALANLIAELNEYFQTTDLVGTLSSANATALSSSYDDLLAQPTKENYMGFKAVIDGSLIRLTPGAYYVVRSADPNFYTSQSVTKAWYCDNSGETTKVKWQTEDANSAYQVFQVVSNGNGGNVFYNPMVGVYLTSTNGTVTTDISEANTFTLSNLGAVGQYNILMNGEVNPIHANGHSNGAGVSNTIIPWAGVANSASAWYLVPVSIPEVTLISPNNVIDGDEVFQSFAYGSNKQLPLNMGVYYISGLIGNYAHIETISSNEIKANQGYIIRGVKGAAIPMLPIESISEEPTNNILVGVTEQTTVNSGYILAYKNGDSEAKFYKIKSSGLTIPAYRSYIPGSSPVPGLEMIFGGIGEGEVTGIDEITTGVNGINDGAIYDLQGRRVTNATKGGIYIINGKKVIK